MDSPTHVMVDKECEKKAIAIKGDGDRIQKRTHNSDLEDIQINSMIDQVCFLICFRLTNF